MNVVNKYLDSACSFLYERSLFLLDNNPHLGDDDKLEMFEKVSSIRGMINDIEMQVNSFESKYGI